MIVGFDPRSVFYGKVAEGRGGVWGFKPIDFLRKVVICGKYENPQNRKPKERLATRASRALAVSAGVYITGVLLWPLRGGTYTPYFLISSRSTQTIYTLSDVKARLANV